MISQRLYLAADPTPCSDRNRAPHKVGLIVLSTDLSCERDFAAMRMSHQTQSDLRFNLHANRIDFDNPITEENLAAMLPRITQCVAQILPGETLDAVIFNCTAASALLGDKAIEASIHEVQPNAAVITTASSAVKQLQAIGSRRVSVLAPYTERISRLIVNYFEQHDLCVESLGYLGIEDDRQIGRLRHHQIIAAAGQCVTPDAQALFISCTGTPAVPILDDIQAAIGRPCLSSNICAFAQTMLELEQINA